MLLSSSARHRSSTCDPAATSEFPEDLVRMARAWAKSFISRRDRELKHETRKTESVFGQLGIRLRRLLAGRLSRELRTREWSEPASSQQAVRPAPCCRMIDAPATGRWSLRSRRGDSAVRGCAPIRRESCSLQLAPLALAAKYVACCRFSWPPAKWAVAHVATKASGRTRVWPRLLRPPPSVV